MIRNLLGSLLALIGAAAAVYSPFRPWYDGRLGRDFRLDELFQGGGITGADAALLTGMFVLMVVAAAVAVLGVLLQSRLTVVSAGVLCLGFTILWMVRQGQAAGSLSAGNTGGLASGAWLALGGAFLLLLAGAVLPGRRAMARRRVAEPGAAGAAAAGAGVGGGAVAGGPFRGEPGWDEDTLEQPYAGPPPPQQPYPEQQPYPGQPGMRGAPPQEPYPPGPPPPEPGAPPPGQPFKGPEQQYARPQAAPEEREPYEPQPGTQGAPLDEPYEPRPEAEGAPRPEAEGEPRPEAEGEPPDNTRRFPTAPPPPEEQRPEDEDTWPHRGRDAA
ncbi:hypothetical protein ACQEU8_33740 [Streptomyces sp. CA-250714]|uniref:hypothetical protein n=1 Tax=Streptomyces sp. CA-250714 TaxID=3240060 RepID=UPI003D8E7786